MAKCNRTELATNRPEDRVCIEGVPRIFATTFPGVDLLWFRAERHDSPRHMVSYEAEAGRLIEFGLATRDMIPPTRATLYSETTSKPGGEWLAKRRANGRVEITIWGLPDPLPALAVIGPDRWPFFASPMANREHCLDGLEKAAQVASTLVRVSATGIDDIYLKPYGFRVHADDQAQLNALIAECATRIEAAVVDARIERIGNHLRVVRQEAANG